jgi:hypothetical protein
MADEPLLTPRAPVSIVPAIPAFDLVLLGADKSDPLPGNTGASGSIGARFGALGADVIHIFNTSSIFHTIPLLI